MIVVEFLCGHAVQNDGAAKPRCACGEARIRRVVAKAPTFKGYARGPCADYQELPAKPAVFKEQE
jgi:hypothetical protein